MLTMPRSSTRHFRPLYIGEWALQDRRQQEEIAEATDITDAYLSELMSGRKKNPSVHILRALSRVLGITIDDFYTRPPTSAQMDRLKNLSPAEAATLSRILDQAKSRK